MTGTFRNATAPSSTLSSTEKRTAAVGRPHARRGGAAGQGQAQLLGQQRADRQEIGGGRIDVEEVCALAVELEGDHLDAAPGVPVGDKRDLQALEAALHLEEALPGEPPDLGEAVGEPGGEGPRFAPVALFGRLVDLEEVGNEAAIRGGGPPQLAQGVFEENVGEDGPAQMRHGRVRVVPDPADPPQPEMGFGIVGRDGDHFVEDGLSFPDPPGAEKGQSADGPRPCVGGGV